MQGKRKTNENKKLIVLLEALLFFFAQPLTKEGAPFVAVISEIFPLVKANVELLQVALACIFVP